MRRCKEKKIKPKKNSKYYTEINSREKKLFIHIQKTTKQHYTHLFATSL